MLVRALYTAFPDIQAVSKCVAIRIPRRCVSIIFIPLAAFSQLFPRITSIIISRFILNLRCSLDGKSTSASSQPTLQFAQRVEDGLGGSLSGTWRSEIDEDEVDEITESVEHLEVLNGEHHME